MCQRAPLSLVGGSATTRSECRSRGDDIDVIASDDIVERDRARPSAATLARRGGRRTVPRACVVGKERSATGDRTLAHPAIPGASGVVSGSGGVPVHSTRSRAGRALQQRNDQEARISPFGSSPAALIPAIAARFFGWCDAGRRCRRP
jgi:hypothetical protein